MLILFIFLFRNAVEHARSELVAAGEREVNLERQKNQIEVNFAHRTEELERAQLERGETLLRQTQAAREAAEARVAKLVAESEAREQFIASLLRDRDAALATLHEAGLEGPVERRLEVESSAGAAARAKELEAKNERLMELVKQMRSDMANLTLINQEAGNTTVESCSPRKSPTTVPMTPLGESRQAQQLIKDGARLRQERIDLLAQVRRQQVRINALEAQLEEERVQTSQSRVALDQLQFQVDSTKRHGEVELQTARRRLAEAELQAAELRRESDEFYKGNIEMARRVEELEAQLLMLQVDKGRIARPNEVNFGGQELLIEQLRQELDQVQGRLREAEAVSGGLDALQCSPGSEKETGRETSLRAKLKLAVTRLKALAKENETLKAINNRLTYDLRKLDQQKSQPPTSKRFATAVGAATPVLSRTAAVQPVKTVERPASVRAGMRAKLAELEHAQYELSRKQLTNKAAVGDKGKLYKKRSTVVSDEAGTEEEQDHYELGTLISSVDGGGESLAAVWHLLEPPVESSTQPTGKYVLCDAPTSVTTSSDTLAGVVSLNVKGRAVNR